LKNILSGVDTLESSIYIWDWIIDDFEWKIIDVAKKSARDNDLKVKDNIISIAGIDFSVERSGNPNYEYILNCDDFTLKLHRNTEHSDKIPNIHTIERS